MNRRAKAAWVLFFALAIMGTRLPLAPRQLFSFDDVNFAWAIGKFDVRLSQPQPPGYPLFVLQMRLLDKLRFKNAQSNLMALSLAASLAAVLLVWAFGNRFFGGNAGLCAAFLLLFYPSFWYAALTSAVRVQLAVVSVGVAAACHRAWCGHRRWLLWSAMALGVGAGIRPELGPLLLPLWLVSAWRARVSWRYRALALALLVGIVLAWLAPTAMLSGGPKTYFEVCWKYLRDQAALTSPAFGASGRLWQLIICRLLVWTFVGVLAWPLFLIPLCRRHRSPALNAEQRLFLALWLAPSLIFALLVHVADAGQTLAMVVVVCLVGGQLMRCTLEEIEQHPPSWHGLIWLVVALALATHLVSKATLLLLIPPFCLACGWLLSKPAPAGLRPAPRAHTWSFLLAPVLLLDLLIFFYRGWSFKGGPEFWSQILEDLRSGLAFTSREQIRATATLDDRSLRAIRQLTEGHPRLAVILWEHGLLSWRKAAYYYHYLPVVVLDRKTLAGPAPSVATVWRGSRLEQRLEGPPPLRIVLPRGGRLIWLLNPASDFPARLREHFFLAEMGPVYFCDLPETSGSRRIGDFLLTW